MTTQPSVEARQILDVIKRELSDGAPWEYISQYGASLIDFLANERTAAARQQERERCANHANRVRVRAADNATAIKTRTMSLDKSREIDWHLSGQRHAASEIEKAIRDGSEP